MPRVSSHGRSRHAHALRSDFVNSSPSPTQPSDQPQAGFPRVPTPQAGLGFVVLVAVLFFVVGGMLQVALGEMGLLVGEWLLMFLPALGLLTLGGYSWSATLSLRMPSPASLAASALMMAGALPIVWGVTWIQSLFFPVPPEVLESLEALVTAETPGRLLWLLLALAATPAICEEIVFRGVLLGSCRALPPWRMILLNGVCFGAFHLSLDTWTRFLPAALLGIVIAWTVWRTGSIITGVLMHLFNNGFIVLLASVPDSVGAVPDPEAPPPLWLVPAAAVALGIGIRILAAGPDEKPIQSTGSSEP